MSAELAPRMRRRLRIWRRKITLGSFAVDTNYSIEMSDLAVDVIEDRLSSIEEIIAARWPQSMFLRRRLARELRAMSATFAWAGPDFRTRRAESTSEAIVLRSPRRPL